VLVPLFVGSHTIHGQALSSASIHSLGGWLELPVPTYPITTSRVELRVGLPADVHAIALFGGDRAQWFVRWEDGAALAAGVLAAWLTFRTRGRRALGAVVWGGLWFIAPALYVVAMATFFAAMGIWVTARLVPRKYFAGAAVGVASTAAVLCLVLAGATLATRGGMASNAPPGPETTRGFHEDARLGQLNVRSQATQAVADAEVSRVGNFAGQIAGAGVVQGATPVALALPSFERSVSASRELVTRDRPFKPTLLYVTTSLLVPLAAAWAAALLLLAFAHRAELVALWRRLRRRLFTPTDPAPAAPPPVV